jgi:hypothetical protein
MVAEIPPKNSSKPLSLKKNQKKNVRENLKKKIRASIHPMRVNLEPLFGTSEYKI